MFYLNKVFYTLKPGIYCLGNCPSHILFKHVGMKKNGIDKNSFLQLLFASKGLHTINIDNILHQNATTISNYKHVIQYLNMDDFKTKSHDCCCSSF